jgi:hypothetical protein
MVITLDRILSALVFLTVGVLGATLFNPFESHAAGAVLAALLALPGALLIWFSEDIGEFAGFSRGVFRASPPALVMVLGWLFLLGLPLLYAWATR